MLSKAANSISKLQAVQGAIITLSVKQKAIFFFNLNLLNMLIYLKTTCFENERKINFYDMSSVNLPKCLGLSGYV